MQCTVAIIDRSPAFSCYDRRAAPTQLQLRRNGFSYDAGRQQSGTNSYQWGRRLLTTKTSVQIDNAASIASCTSSPSSRCSR